MVTYTDKDIAGYKAALSRYAAKENALVVKYEKWVKNLQHMIDECQSLLISSARDSAIDKFSLSLDYVNAVLADIKTPADMFLTDFEMRNCG